VFALRVGLLKTILMAVKKAASIIFDVRKSVNSSFVMKGELHEKYVFDGTDCTGWLCQCQTG
jgi:hypothetical protein